MIINCDKQDCRQCRFHRCYLGMAINYEKKTIDGEERAMTRDEAIDIMKVVIHMLDDDYDDRVEIAIQMAIEALQAEPVCEHFYKGYCSRFDDGCFHQCQAEPKHGKWIEEKDGWYGGQGCRCSSCGYGYSYKAYHEPYEFDYCPNCGAKMDKE